jgi:hypothetical protein
MLQVRDGWFVSAGHLFVCLLFERFVRLQLQRPCCMTTFADCPGQNTHACCIAVPARLSNRLILSPGLGRVTLRDKGVTVAVGHVVQVAK